MYSYNKRKHKIIHTLLNLLCSSAIPSKRIGKPKSPLATIFWILKSSNPALNPNLKVRKKEAEDGYT